MQQRIKSISLILLSFMTFVSIILFSLCLCILDLGVDKEHFDPTVLTALSEYARRFTQDILADAKDYATHAGRDEIETMDIRMALTLLDNRTSGIDTKMKALHEAAEEINAIPLPALTIPTGKQLRLPRKDLLNRIYTLCPGKEAYPSPEDASDDFGGGIQLKHSVAENVRSHGVKTALDKRQRAAGYKNIKIDKGIVMSKTVQNDEGDIYSSV